MRRARARVGKVLAAAVTAALLLGGWQWPVSEVAIEVSFGEPTDEGISPGLKIVSGTAQVESAAGGEVVFGLEAGETAHAVPHGLGSFLVLEHEGGFRSLYAHLDRDEGAPRTGYDEGEALGAVGRTGFAGGNTLGFRIVDTERGAYVNPLLLLPELPDEVPPAVEEVALFRGEQEFPLLRGAALPTGTYELLARIYDPARSGPYRDAASPYAVTVFANGRQRFEVALETLTGEEDGAVSFAADRPAAELYRPDGRLRLGRVSVGLGNNLIEIVAEDYAGNERVASFQITGESEQ